MREKDDTEGPVAAPGRRPYAAPAIRWEETYEVKANLASACQKVGGQDFQCNSSPSS